MPNTYTLHTKAKKAHFGGFNCRPAMEFELSSDKILCNEETILPGDYHCYDMRLWVISHEFGAVCAVWATCAQDAIDNAVDCGMMDSEMVSDEDYEKMSEEEREDLLHAGNASEPFYNDYLQIYEVEFDKLRDYDLLIAFARCADNNSLDY
jgi:hypothetical protein